MKIKHTIISSLLLIVCAVFSATVVHAQSTLTPTQVKLINPIGGTEKNPEGTVDVPVILGNVLKTALQILGSAALFMFVVGGVLWLTSAGNSERVKKGTQTMVWAAIGVLIIFSSYAILSLVLEGIGASGSGPPKTDPANPVIPNDGSSICLCHTQDKQNGQITDSQLVDAATKDACESYPSVTGQFDACGFIPAAPSGCLCQKYTVDKSGIANTQQVGGKNDKTSCEGYPSETGLFDQCYWVGQQ